MEKDIFDDGNLVQSNWFKFSVIGDFIHGTLVSVRDIASNLPGKEGTLVKAYEIKADGGSFHSIVDGKPSADATEIAAGDMWNVGGGFLIDNALRNVKLGQKIGIKYTEDRPNKKPGFSPLKVKKVYTPRDADGSFKMDKQWLEENTGEIPF